MNKASLPYSFSINTIIPHQFSLNKYCWKEVHSQEADPGTAAMVSVTLLHRLPFTSPTHTCMAEMSASGMTISDCKI